MDRWNDWDIKELIGEGTFGKVYRIERNTFGRTYEAALKVIRIPSNRAEFDNAISEGMSEEDAKAYFRDMAEEFSNEFAFMSELKGNSNIVSFEDFEVVPHEDGYSWDVFIRMELLEPFTKRIGTSEMSEEEIVELGTDMCRALELCEQKNIIHRDIKPANIFISPQGTYKLGDFGIARELEKTSAGLSKKGTYSYMAPEIYRGEEYGPSADIYSLGMVLYRLVNNNRLPFLPEPPNKIKYTDTEEANKKRLSGETIPMPANADNELGRIILKACAFDPEERYKRATEMRKDLELYRSSKENKPDTETKTAESDKKTTPKKSKEKPAELKESKEKPAEGKKEKSSGSKKSRSLIFLLAAAILAVAAIAFFNSDTSGISFKHKDEDANESIYIEDKEVDDNDLKSFTDNQSAAHLYFKRCKISDAMMQKISEITGVKSLDISECTGFNSFDPLADMELQSIHLEGKNTADNEEDKPLIDDLISRDFTACKSVDLNGWTTKDGGSVIKNFDGVERLHLDGIIGAIDMNNVADNSFLSGLTMYDCTAKDDDFSMMSKCTELYSFTAEGCGLNDISWMKPLTNLAYVTVNNNNLTSLIGLENHEGLFNVSAGSNQITDISGLSGCSGLMYLELDNNEISDISALSDCPELIRLYATNNKITDISSLSVCEKITELLLDDNSIENLDACDMMIDLRVISAANNSLKDIKGLSNTTQLENINLSGNEITDISAIADNRDNLKIIRLSDNQLKDISALSECNNLEMVSIDNNQIKDLSGLEGKKLLGYLSAGRNEIISIKALSESKRLLYADFGDNQISDISMLSDHGTEGQVLMLHNNDIRDISALPKAAGYYLLSLYGNPISDLSQISNSTYEYLYLPWEKTLDYSHLARAGYDKANVVDTPEEERGPLKVSVRKVREEQNLDGMLYRNDPSFKTNEEADADMGKVRKEAKSQEDGTGNMAYSLRVLEE